jgi:hypothetical protein
LAPNDPPIGGATIRTRSGASPNRPARSARVLNGVCVPAQTVSRPSSHWASAACGSIGTCAALGVRNVSSTTRSASANPAATSPLTSRKRWHTFVPATGRTPIETASPAGAAVSACRSTASGATAATASNTAGSSSYSTSTTAAAARAAARVGAATAATTSPAYRATSASTRWSRA